jgi:hypothetical protein
LYWTNNWSRSESDRRKSRVGRRYIELNDLKLMDTTENRTTTTKYVKLFEEWNQESAAARPIDGGSETTSETIVETETIPIETPTNAEGGQTEAHVL